MIGVGPVRQVVLQQGTVGDERFGAIPELQHAGTDADAGHRAPVSAHVEHITYPEGALEQDDDAADEVLQQVLGAESQADGQRAAQEREHGERDLHRHKAEDDQGDDEHHPRPATNEAGLVGLHFQSLDREPLQPAR